MFFSRFWMILAMLFVLLFAQFHVYALSTGNIGFNFSQVIDDQSIGLTGEYNYDGDGFGFEADGDLQSGDIYRGKLHAEFTFDVSSSWYQVDHRHDHQRLYA